MGRRFAAAHLRNKGLSFSISTFVLFWAIAIFFWKTTGHLFFILNFGYIGTALGLGSGLYSILPKHKKPIGRRLAQVLVGVYMLGFLGLLARENMQLEGFFFQLLAGSLAGAVIHYAVAKLVGPLIFGRGFCGWACWTAMALDLLPYPRSRGWLPRWRWVRYAHFLASAALVLTLVYFVGYHYHRSNALLWIITGNALYFAIALPMAVVLRDNRAFCKYACPVPVVMTPTSRFALVKVAGTQELCDRCDACIRTCPGSIRIPDYIHAGKRVVSTECVLCQTCVSTCPSGALRLSIGLDAGFDERLWHIETSSPARPHRQHM
jgi:polyferredoxin